MSAKTMSSVKDENRDMRKQIGCMNGIFQIFDRHHFLAGRRMSGNHPKRLLQGSQYQLDPHYTSKAVTEKTLEAKEEKPRISTESSRASYSSSSCSSTFSSLDFNKIAQTETIPHKRKNKPEIPFPITPTEEPQSLDLRDVVKDSMDREAHGLSIKPLAKDEKRGTLMKHIDSPRPSLQSKPKTPKPIIPQGSTRVLARAHQNTKDERLALPRFSYDGRESQDALKWAMKHKELPRHSLDSKASSMKCSGLESRLNFLKGPHTEKENSGHNRTSSVLAKLMGLEKFPDTICQDENRTQNEATYSPHVSQNNPASPSPTIHSSNFVRKPNTSSRFPIEPATWRQQDSSQISPKMAAQSRKAPTNNRNLSPTVYSEIEKRVTELQFQKSGKDLRALKQILEAMQKTREQIEDQKGESNSSIWKNNRSYHRAPTIEGPRMPKKSASYVDIAKSAKVMDKVRIPVSTSKNHVEKKSAHSQKTKDLTSKNNNLKDPTRHLDRPQRKKVENCTAPGRSFRTVSLRLQQNLFRIEGQSPPTATSSDSSRVKRHCVIKGIGKGLQNRKHKVKAKDMQPSDDQLSENSIDTRYSSYQNDKASIISEGNSSLVSQAATEVTSLVRKENYVSATREHIKAVKTVVTVSEQPSPISVLDDTFYCEDSPSPVTKISTVFQDDSLIPDEAEWHLDNLNHLTNCARSNHTRKDNHKLENLKTSVQELSFLTEPDSTAVDHNVVLSHNPEHRYINKILLTSGFLKDPSFISTTDQHLSSCHLINPDMFHVLEQTEEISGKSDKIQLKNKSQRKNIFDMVNEILARPITSGRLFASVSKNTSPQGLLKEVYLEMDLACMIQECNLEDEDDEMIRLLTADMMYQDDWVDYNGEVPALVLDIERQIFKELINEVITGVVTGLNDGPLRHCRKMFSK